MGAENRKKIQDTIRELGRADAYEIHQGKVLSVDQDTLTMDVEVLELTHYDVRLRAVVTDDTGIWVIPKEGSYVTIGQIEGGVDLVLIRASEIDKVCVKIGGKTLVMDADALTVTYEDTELKLNDDEVKISLDSKTLSMTQSRLLATYANTTLELKDDYAQIISGSKDVHISNDAVVVNGGINEGMVKVNALVQELNTTQAKLNKILSVLLAWTPTPNDGGLALKTALLALPTTLQPVTPTTKIDIENPDATH